MSTSQLKEPDYLKTWGLFVLCATIGGFVAGAIVGGILGAFLGLVKTPPSVLRFLCGAVGFIASLPISYFCFRYFVSREIVQKLNTTSAVQQPTRAAA